MTKVSFWSVNYEKEFPIVKLVDCNGKEQFIDINEIVLKERGILAIQTLDIIKKFMKEKLK